MPVKGGAGVALGAPPLALENPAAACLGSDGGPVFAHQGLLAHLHLAGQLGGPGRQGGDRVHQHPGGGYGGQGGPQAAKDVGLWRHLQQLLGG